MKTLLVKQKGRSAGKNKTKEKNSFHKAGKNYERTKTDQKKSKEKDNNAPHHRKKNKQQSNNLQKKNETLTATHKNRRTKTNAQK